MFHGKIHYFYLDISMVIFNGDSQVSGISYEGLWRQDLGIFQAVLPPVRR